MRINKKFIGQFVEVSWKDPSSDTVDVIEGQFPRGNSALAGWKERGVLIDLTDGVLTIQHSVCEIPNGWPRYHCTWVPEELVIAIDPFIRDKDNIAQTE